MWSNVLVLKINALNTEYHYDDVIMSEIASQITSLTIVYSIVHSGTDQSKHQSSASLAFVWEIHRWPVNFPRKWPVTRKMFPFDDVIMEIYLSVRSCLHLTRSSWNSYSPMETFILFVGGNNVLSKFTIRFTETNVDIHEIPTLEMPFPVLIMLDYFILHKAWNVN